MENYLIYCGSKGAYCADFLKKHMGFTTMDFFFFIILNNKKKNLLVVISHCHCHIAIYILVILLIIREGLNLFFLITVQVIVMLTKMEYSIWYFVE
jgi:hypothetical protein